MCVVVFCLFCCFLFVVVCLFFVVVIVVVLLFFSFLSFFLSLFLSVRRTKVFQLLRTVYWKLTTTCRVV